jgi:hypothetical protein
MSGMDDTLAAVEREVLAIGRCVNAIGRELDMARPAARDEIPVPKLRREILLGIHAERQRQEAQHPGDIVTGDNGARLAILLEEVGEVARCLNEAHGINSLRDELTQVAACCVAWLEGIAP